MALLKQSLEFMGQAVINGATAQRGRVLEQDAQTEYREIISKYPGHGLSSLKWCDFVFLPMETLQSLFREEGSVQFGDRLALQRLLRTAKAE
jgi:hypothetical protein